MPKAKDGRANARSHAKSSDSKTPRPAATLSVPNGVPRPIHQELSPSWTDFRKRLPQALATLRADEYIVLDVLDSNKFLQFAAGEYGDLLIEVTGSQFLDHEERWSDGQVEQLIQSGFKPPESEGGDATPNFHQRLPASTSPEQRTNFILDVLARIFQLSTPTQLEYRAASFSCSDPINHGELGVRRHEEPLRPDKAERAGTFLDVVREVTGLRDLDFDEAGDLTFMGSGLSAAARLSPDSRWLLLNARIIDLEEPTAHLAPRVNALNAEHPGLSLVWQRATVYAKAAYPLLDIRREIVQMAFGAFFRMASSAREQLEFELGDPCRYNGSPSVKTIQ